MLLPSRLIELRDWLGLSQEAMAQLIGVSFASVNRWERGHSSPTGTVLEVYRALDVAKKGRISAERILGDTPGTPGERLYRIFKIAYGGRR